MIADAKRLGRAVNSYLKGTKGGYGSICGLEKWRDYEEKRRGKTGESGYAFKVQNQGNQAFPGLPIEELGEDKNLREVLKKCKKTTEISINFGGKGTLLPAGQDPNRREVFVFFKGALRKNKGNQL